VRSLLIFAFCLSTVSAAAADLAEVRIFLGQTAYDEARISPDGARLAFITRQNDFERDREVFGLWLADLADRAAKPVRIAEPAGPSGLRWSPDGRSLTFLSGGRLFLLTPGSEPRRLGDLQGGVELYEWLPDGSGLVVAAGSLLRLGLADGKAERLGAAPFEAVESLAVSPDGRWLAVTGGGLRQTTDTAELALLSLKPGSAPRRTRNLIYEEIPVWAGKDLLVAGTGEARDGRYTATEARLYRADPDPGEPRLARIASGLRGHLYQQVPLPDGSVRVEPATGNVRTLREHRGWIAGLSASRDGRRIAFIAGDPRHFSEIYVADGWENLAGARPVTDFNASLSRSPLPEIETVSWDDGEGVSVEGVLFWPPGRKGEKGLPLIVDLHGGPFGVARTEAVDLYGSYASYPALLAARGYLVLNPNYRGSAGRGDDFARGIEGHHCSVPSREVIRGVEDLIARGWADRGRLGLIGYSGGGSLSKCLVGRTDLPVRHLPRRDVGRGLLRRQAALGRSGTLVERGAGQRPGPREDAHPDRGRGARRYGAGPGRGDVPWPPLARRDGRIPRPSGRRPYLSQAVQQAGQDGRRARVARPLGARQTLIRGDFQWPRPSTSSAPTGSG
jgi:dipeptidyl aminopeptidase/acylaminoacyl peptidase